MGNLPGGGVESRELPTEAVVREVKEETGLNIVVDRLIGVYGHVEIDDLIFSFICRVIGGQLVLSDEADRHCFFDPENLPPNISPKHIERIQDALRPAGQPIFRRHSVPSSQDIIEKG